MWNIFRKIIAIGMLVVLFVALMMTPFFFLYQSAKQITLVKIIEIAGDHPGLFCLFFVLFFSTLMMAWGYLFFQEKGARYRPYYCSYCSKRKDKSKDDHYDDISWLYMSMWGSM